MIGATTVRDGASESAEEITKRDNKIEMLESKVASLVEEKQAIQAELATAQTIASASMASKESELSKRDEIIKTLEKQLASEGKLEAKDSPDETNADDVEKLRLEIQSLKKDLQNKTSSLETAKMMITSLESASGSQANELRAKLKERSVCAQHFCPFWSRCLHYIEIMFAHLPSNFIFLCPCFTFLAGGASHSQGSS